MRFAMYHAATYFAPTYFGDYFQTGSVADLCVPPTLAGAAAALAARLNDPTYIRWTAAENRRYIIEALRTWNVWTSYWRASAEIDLPFGAAFVDLHDVLADLRPATVTNWDLVTDLQYTLLEPPAPGGTWTGTPQFTLAQLNDAIARRRDQFLRETGIVQTRQITPEISSLTGRYHLPSCTLQIRRAAWRPTATQLLVPLNRADGWSAAAFSPTWTTPGTPLAYGTSASPPTWLQLYPPPAAVGTLDLLTVNAGPAVDPLVDASLGIPNDYAWVIKYGALADLLGGDGLALDAARASYCESRWQQGVELARRQAVTLTAAIQRVDANGDPVGRPVTCRLGSVADADAYAPLWQLLAGMPQTLLLAGQNLLGIWPPVGGGGTYTVQIAVVRAAPIPIYDAAVLDLPSDIYDAILDLAQHAALVKEGPGQIEQALPLLERAARAAGIDLQLQQAGQPARRALHGQQAQDMSTVPYRLPPVPVEVG